MSIVDALLKIKSENKFTRAERDENIDSIEREVKELSRCPECFSTHMVKGQCKCCALRAELRKKGMYYREYHSDVKIEKSKPKLKAVKKAKPYVYEEISVDEGIQYVSMHGVIFKNGSLYTSKGISKIYNNKVFGRHFAILRGPLKVIFVKDGDKLVRCLTTPNRQLSESHNSTIQKILTLLEYSGFTFKDGYFHKGETQLPIISLGVGHQVKISTNNKIYTFTIINDEIKAVYSTKHRRKR